jgi:hypothetical protein
LRVVMVALYHPLTPARIGRVVGFECIYAFCGWTPRGFGVELVRVREAEVDLEMGRRKIPTAWCDRGVVRPFDRGRDSA